MEERHGAHNGNYGEKKLAYSSFYNTYHPKGKEQRAHYLKEIIFYEEADLLYFYCADLIMIKKYTEAISIIKDVGLSYDPAERKPYWIDDKLAVLRDIFRANMHKLLALALLEQQLSEEAQENFEAARLLFIQHGVVHGFACCDLALGQLKLSKDSLTAETHFNTAIKLFDAIGHNPALEVTLNLRKDLPDTSSLEKLAIERQVEQLMQDRASRWKTLNSSQNKPTLITSVINVSFV